MNPATHEKALKDGRQEDEDRLGCGHGKTALRK